ncbi:MAG: type I methionyl aminopeptidase [Candidatus Kapaibacterium sp.]|nr:type I methionyl aminopeptidase [Bacteroidota bacterium]
MEQTPAIKIKTDVDYIEESCRLVSDTIQCVGKNIKEGVSTLELDRIAEDFIRSHDAEPAFKGFGGDENLQPFPYTLCISVNEEVVHGMPGQRTLKNGDIVSIDCGVKKNGFYGDSAFTFPVGEISSEKQHLLDVTLESLNLGVAQAITGNTNYDIAKAVQQHVEKNGYSVVRELVGHGIGSSLHQEPSVPNFVPGLLHRNKFQKVKLKKGLTIAIEPMVNVGTFQVRVANDGWTIVTADRKPSAHFEHTIMVDDGKPVVLTYF